MNKKNLPGKLVSHWFVSRHSCLCSSSIIKCCDQNLSIPFLSVGIQVGSSDHKTFLRWPPERRLRGPLCGRWKYYRASELWLTWPLKKVINIFAVSSNFSSLDLLICFDGLFTKVKFRPCFNVGLTMKCNVIQNVGSWYDLGSGTKIKKMI